MNFLISDPQIIVLRDSEHTFCGMSAHTCGNTYGSKCGIMSLHIVGNTV